jgi:hypothetical protein
MSLDEDHKDRLERMKILYDLTKHVTTLSMGTLLLMAGWFDKVFKNPVWKPVAAGSFLLFASCIVLSVFAMFGFSMYSRSTFDTPNDPINFARNFFALALVFFGFGVSSFTAFTLRNLM